MYYISCSFIALDHYGYVVIICTQRSFIILFNEIQLKWFLNQKYKQIVLFLPAYL